MKTETDLYGRFFSEELKKVELRISKLFKNENPDSLYEPCSYIIKSGGKRLRPLLVILCAKAVGGDIKSVYNAAVAVELLHNFTLVHDDIMDNADKRRGRTTLHKKYDLSTAILSGDSLLAFAYLNLLKDTMENDKSVLSSFTKGVVEVCEGQSLDKEFETNDKVTIDDYLIMIKKKTAALLEMCCSIGAQLGGGSIQKQKALANYGRNMGMAFQLQDDLLDIIAEETEFGKVIGGDLVEGKKTFLFLNALEKAKGKDKILLKSVIKNKGIKKEEVSKFKELFYKLGVIEDTEKEIIRYTKLALKETKVIESETDRNMLVWLASSLIKRNK
ncbi:MAG: polyprenyl synthetase family protein [Clostridiales bacterium]